MLWVPPGYTALVAPETATLTWDDIKALSGMPAVDAGSPSVRSPQAWGEPERVAGLVRSYLPLLSGSL